MRLHLSLRRGFAAVAGTLGLTLAAMFTAVPAAHAATVNYVALGDSYSAGVGSGSYISASGSCYRSTKAAAYLWQASHSVSSFTFAACSGATTTDVLGSQISSLSSSTTLVSISIGGNDAGFSDTMQTCVLSGTSACVSAVNTAKTYIENTLPARLDAVYSAIVSHAPGAHVVVLDYPHLYQVPGSCLFGISDTSRTAINSAADDLATVTAKEVAKYGFSFGDVRSVFATHEICGSSTQWLHSTTLPVYESYHPTATGQSSGYLPVLSANV